MSTARNVTQYDKCRFYFTVGETIRAMREDAGLSKSGLAVRANLTKATIEHAEDGTNCSLLVAARIAEALDTTLDALVPLEAT